MRVLICGGRDYSNQTFFNNKLDAIQKERGAFTIIIQGGAKGADYLAHLYSAKRGIKEEVYNAEWKMYGKTAGPIRNRRMLYEGKPDLVVAFPGGAGTTDMKKQARNAGVEVIEFNKEESMVNFVEPSNEG